MTDTRFIIGGAEGAQVKPRYALIAVADQIIKLPRLLKDVLVIRDKK